MKRTLPYLIFFFCCSNTWAQKTEFALSVNSGLFHYTGSNSASHSFFNSDGINQGYTNQSFGQLNGLCNGLGINIKRISKKGWMFGTEMAYEKLVSRVIIDEVSLYSNIFYSIIVQDIKVTKGKTNLISTFANIYPFFGKRFALGNVKTDVSAGFDLAIPVGIWEKGIATGPDGTTYTTNRTNGTQTFEIKPRMQLGFRYHKEGIYMGYSYGLSNLSKGLIGDAAFSSYTRYLRFGISYTL